MSAAALLLLLVVLVVHLSHGGATDRTHDRGGEGRHRYDLSASTRLSARCIFSLGFVD